MAAKVPDLSLLNGVVAPEILAAMRSASAQLARTGVRHALAGSLAVGAWGYPRASKGVDFLVGDEALMLAKFDGTASEAQSRSCHRARCC